MEEAFLLQMNDFDRFLETQLRHMLDPVVATPPPVRGRRQVAFDPVLVVEPQAPVMVIEPVTVAVAAVPLPQH